MEESIENFHGVETIIEDVDRVSLLIQVIQNYPYLYDLSDRRYKDNNKKEEAWSQLSELVYMDVDTCKRTWKNLRDRFTKEKRGLPPGSGVQDCSWPYFEKMMFYTNYTKPRKKMGKLKPIRIVAKKREYSIDDIAKDNIKIENDVKQNIKGEVEVVKEEHRSQSSDEDYHFGRMVAAAVANIRNNKKKLKVKAKILLLIAEESD